jgi:hypothetical protein
VIVLEKITRTYRFDQEVIEHAEKNFLISSFANWACEAYRKEFLSIETKKAQLDEALLKVRQLEQELLALQNSTDLCAFLKKEELFWLKNEANKRIEKASFEGVYRFFCNTFNRVDINRHQFRLLVERFK